MVDLVANDNTVPWSEGVVETDCPSNSFHAMSGIG